MKKFVCFLLVMVLLAMSLTACSNAQADDAGNWPQKTIKFIVPFGAGGDTDLAARIITDKLSRNLGVTIVVENISGGSGVVGHTQMVNSDSDGYTFLFNQLGSHVTQTQLGNTTYAYEDSSVICGMGSFPQCFVVKADSEWQTFQDMVDWAKANPGKLTYGTQGVGGLGHTCALDAFTQLGVQAQDVAFSSTAESVTGVLGGHVMLTCCPIAGAASYIKSGDLRLLALSNTFYQFPDAPVVADYGTTDGMYSWIALFAPKGIDEEIRQKMITAIEEVMQDEEVQEKLKDFGIEVNFVPGDEFRAVMDTEYQRNHDALLAAGLIAE